MSSWADAAEEDDTVIGAISKLKSTNPVSPKDEEDPIPSIEKKLLEKPTDEHLAKGSLIVQQADPNSPLYSAKSFQELNLGDAILRGITDMGFNKPSKIQETALPILLSTPPTHLIAQAQSGTGKTAAFVINMLSRCNVDDKFPQALTLCPTRELARQIYDNITALGKYTGLKVRLVVPEENFGGKIDAQIVVGTPGKMFDVVKTNTLDLKRIKVFVLDEADVMIGSEGKLVDTTIKIKRMMPKTCQFTFFSATYPPKVEQYANDIVPQPRSSIKLKREELTVEAIKQLYIECGSEAGKFKVLDDIYCYLTVGQSIIFVHTRNKADELERKMKEAGHAVSKMHGQLETKDRDKVLDDFRSAKTKVLITTNVFARGIDILQVTLVINYDLPLNEHNKIDVETYLHRIGRGGRFGKKGIAINFVHDQESRANLKYLENFYKKPIDEFPANKLEDIQPMLENLGFLQDDKPNP